MAGKHSRNRGLFGSFEPFSWLGFKEKSTGRHGKGTPRLRGSRWGNAPKLPVGNGNARARFASGGSRGAHRSMGGDPFWGIRMGFKGRR